MHALSVKGLTKTYKNGVQALKGIDLEVEEGDFFALLGPNGAGKTTLIGIVTSLVNKTAGQASVFGQIILLDLLFSVDSIITAVSMTEHVPIMVIAVVVTVAIMMVAATPLANFIHNNPSLVMLALGFLLLIGTTLVADAFGAHIPKGYIYTAMAFSVMVEMLNMRARRAEQRRRAAAAAAPAEGAAGH